MNFNIIVAVDTNNGIGLNNTIPWYEPEDLKHFAKLTKGNGKNAVIMGKNTWNSLPQRWLHNRFNIIISRNLDISGTNFQSFKDPKKAIEYCIKKEYETVWIMGGGEIYNYFINNNLVDNIYISKLDKCYNCDVFFPEIPDTMALNSRENLTNTIKLEVYSSNSGSLMNNPLLMNEGLFIK